MNLYAKNPNVDSIGEERASLNTFIEFYNLANEVAIL